MNQARRPRLQFPRIALYPALLAIALVVEMLNVSGTSPFAAGRGVIVVVVAALIMSSLGRLLLGEQLGADRGQAEPPRTSGSVGRNILPVSATSCGAAMIGADR